MNTQVNRKQRNHQNLLDEGVRLIMLRGYHATGIKELVDTVGVPKGSFYQYFQSKEQFGAAAIAHYIAPFVQRLHNKLQEYPHDAKTALHSYFDELTTEAQNNNFEGGCLLGNLLGEIGDQDGDCLVALKLAVDDYCEQMRLAIEQGQAEGSFTRDLPAADLTHLLFSTWQGALLRMKVERSTTPLRQSIQSLLDHCFRA